MSASGYDHDLERFGIKRKWQVVGANPRYTFGVKCATCDSFRDRAYRMEPPPDQIAKQLRLEGWYIDGRKNTCPVCLEKQKSERRAKQAMSGSTQDTTRATVAVYEALTKAYSKEQGRYRTGHDDVSVAQETKTSPVFVGRVRVATFGQPKMDPEIERIEGSIKAVEEMLAEIKHQVVLFRAKK